MESRIEIEMLPGCLIGPGREIPCTVGARRISLPETGAIKYRTLGICGVSDDIPDGHYQVTFAGQTFPIRRHRGAWISSTALDS